LALDFSKYKDKVIFAEVDCSVYTDICGSISIKNYPTIRYYMDNQEGFKEFGGNYSYDELSRFVASYIGVFYKIRDSHVKVLTPDTFNEVINIFVSIFFLF
jgi:thioredoxin-like negative regulator of GroEL